MSFVHQFLKGSSPWTLLLLHGTGGDEKDLLPLGRLLAPEASLLSPLGKVLEGRAPRFFRRFAEGVFDMEDLVFRTNELADWLAEAYGEYNIDSDKVVAVGYSNGATTAASLMLLRPESLFGAIALRPSVPAVPDQLPDLTGKHVLLVPGESDAVVPPEQAYELSRIVEKAQGSATVVPVSSGHGLTNTDVEIAKRWIYAMPGR